MLGAVAVIVAAAIGGSTFKSWRKQQLAERKLLQAERILEATYKARRALSAVRSPALWGHEMSAAEERLKADPRWDDHLEAKQRRLVTAQAYYDRIGRAQPERDALDQCLPMARALFGEELEKAIEALNHQFWIVRVDVECYIDDNGADPEFSAKLRRGMYDVVPAPNDPANEISDAIKTAVATIEATCLPILRS